MTETTYPVFALGLEDDARTTYRSLPEMTLGDLELAARHSDDETEREHLEELLEKYRHLLTVGFTLDEVVEDFGAFDWCKTARFDDRLCPRSRRPR